MAFSGAKERARSRPKKKQSKKAVEKVPRGRTRPAEQTFPELPDLKDARLMTHAKAFADEMFESEEACDRAKGEKQAIRLRMETLGAHLFIGHGYEFSLTPGEETFKARKVKRGAKPADTTAAVAEAADLDNGAGDEDAYAGEDHGEESLADA